MLLPVPVYLSTKQEEHVSRPAATCGHLVASVLREVALLRKLFQEAPPWEEKVRRYFLCARTARGFGLRGPSKGRAWCGKWSVFQLFFSVVLHVASQQCARSGLVLG